MKVDHPKVPLHRRLGEQTNGVGEPPGHSIEGPELDRMLALLKLELGPLDVVREGRVAELRASVARGSYAVAPHIVARKVLREQLVQLLA
jgi:hypothetical protein